MATATVATCWTEALLSTKGKSGQHCGAGFDPASQFFDSENSAGFNRKKAELRAESKETMKMPSLKLTDVLVACALALSTSIARAQVTGHDQP
jgi:hypothetical protein